MDEHSIKRDVHRFRLPQGWEDETIHTFRGPHDGDMQHYVILMIDDNVGIIDIGQYARRQLESQRLGEPPVEVIRQGERLLTPDLTVYECVSKWIPVDTRILYLRQYYALKNGCGYSFSCEFTKRSLATIGHEVDQLVAAVLEETEELDES